MTPHSLPKARRRLIAAACPHAGAGASCHEYCDAIVAEFRYIYVSVSADGYAYRRTKLLGVFVATVRLDEGAV